MVIDKKHEAGRHRASGNLGPDWDDTGQTPEAWRSLLAAVNEAYLQSDADRGLLERSLELSSDELLQANSEMRTIFQTLPDLFLRLDLDGRVHQAGI